jgi:mono/diheme cytochrome c family protein
MTRSLKLELAAAATIAIALAACAGGMKASTGLVSGAQLGNKPVDPALVQAGVTVWRDKGCYGCHGIGRQFGAPDLAGVTERRDLDWLRKWLKETDTMLQGDPQAMAMAKDWHGQRMPNMKLNDRQIEALLHYMANETARVRGGQS